MRTKIRSLSIFICVLFFAVQCKEPYTPPLMPASQNFLVVDGTVNSTDSIVQVVLSREVPLSSNQTSPGESNAFVTVEDDLGHVWVLRESTAGTYSFKDFFSPDRKYKLRVQTLDGAKYSSDLIEILKTPPIDTLIWTPSSDGLSLNVNAHDDSGKAKYFRWTCEETWEYNSTYESQLIYSSVYDSIIPRQPSQQIYVCWRTVPITEILLYTTSRLQRDEVSNYQVIFVPKGSQKLSREYSVLVKQQALSEEAYNFWYQLQTTTENLGGLFDPLPSQVNGNIICDSNPDQKVLGFFSGSSVVTQRVFIRYNQVPRDLLPPYSNGGCPLDSIPLHQAYLYRQNMLWLNTYGILLTEGYVSTSLECGDCRTQGGTTTKPSFWR